MIHVSVCVMDLVGEAMLDVCVWRGEVSHSLVHSCLTD